MDILDTLEMLYPSFDEEALNFHIRQAEEFIKEYCHIDEVPQSLNSTLLLMVQEDITKHGAEGLQSESTGGNSASYLDDYSDKIYRVLNRRKHVKLVG